MDFNRKSFPLLETIETPEQLHNLDTMQLLQLANELRGFLIESLNICGGHFAANLGTVELSIALHHVFESPKDDLIWDVGHQAYPHKILTGRREQLIGIRQIQGLAPFPARHESDFDSFGVGHSSTSISAGLGMAMANRLQNASGHVVAIIGDGAMTAGMAFEALNHAGDLKANLLVVLNDNDMSISNNVGALSNYFARILSSKLYATVRAGSKKMLRPIPTVCALAKRTEEHVKGLLTPGTLFEELGFNYIGPIDGHDLPLLVDTLHNLRQLPGPQLLHVATTKGKGFPAAEKDPIAYHAVSPGFLKSASSTRFVKPLTYSNIFGRWVCAMAERDPRLVAITPAMREGSDLIEFSKRYPDRYYDVGIAEQHAVTFAAGLACKGLKPIVAIYSTFLQRAYDQLIHDVALQNLPVLFAIDRAGLVGGDGATHQGCFDLAYLRCIPNLVIMTPSDENELYQMLFTGFTLSGPCAIRYPRGQGPGHAIATQMTSYPIGKGVIKRTGQKVAFLAFGPLLAQALEAATILEATVVDMRFVKPLDIELIVELAKTHDLLVTLEENVIQGGAGQAVGAVCHAHRLRCEVLSLGFPDQFIDHGDPVQLLSTLGLTSTAITQRVEAQLAKSSAF